MPDTHTRWVETIEKQKRKDALECLTHEGHVDVPVELEAFKKFCNDTKQTATRRTLDQYIQSALARLKAKGRKS